MQRTCRACKVAKTFPDSFYKSKSGYEYMCKDCRNEISRERHIRNYDAKAARIKHIRRRDAGLYSLSFQRQTQKYPEKYRARYFLHNAVRDGRVLRKPCEVCDEIKAQAHHDDYSKPLDVRWLCEKHHVEHHRNQAQLLRTKAKV